jgi:hypothetical protein
MFACDDTTLGQKTVRRGLIVMTHWFNIPMDDGRVSSVKIIEAQRCLKYLDSIEDFTRARPGYVRVELAAHLGIS